MIMYRKFLIIVVFQIVFFSGRFYARGTDTLRIEKDSIPHRIEYANQIGVMHLQSVYNHDLPTMSTTSLQYLRKINDNRITLIGRANYRARNGNNSVKFDLEAYAKHGKRSYSFIGAAVSDQKMFPAFETYYSFYLALAKGYELETGLKFLSASTFKIFTPVAGLSKEVGNNLITLRNFFTFAEKNRYYGNSFSWKYFLNDDRDHFSLMAGLGNAPDSKNFDFSEQFISNKSQYIGLGFEKNWKPVKLSTAVVYNRNHFSTGSQFDQFDIYLNLFYNFR